MKRLICFDVDGTITCPRTPIEDANVKVLETLAKNHKLIIVGAGACVRNYKQLREFPIDILGNYRMEESHIENGEFKIVRVTKSYPDKEYFLKTCTYLREKYGYTDFAGESVEFHDSGMVTFPILGKSAKIEDKLAFDPDRKKRLAMFDEVKALFPDYSVFIGGTSSFDFTSKEFNKYESIVRYAKENGYERDEILFVGDDFEDGGGDSHIRLGGLDYVCIDSYKNLGKKLEYLF